MKRFDLSQFGFTRGLNLFVDSKLLKNGTRSYRVKFLTSNLQEILGISEYFTNEILSLSNVKEVSFYHTPRVSLKGGFRVKIIFHGDCRI